MRNLPPPWPAPRQLVLFDALGAAITSLLTALALAPGLLRSGLPPLPLYILAAVAAGFCLFGTLALHQGKDPVGTLRVLAAANLSYCITTAVLCFTYWATLTVWGLAYFAGEIVVILALVAAETVTVLDSFRSK